MNEISQAIDKIKFNKLTSFTLNNLKGHAPTEYNYEVIICNAVSNYTIAVIIKVTIKDKDSESKPKLDASSIAKAIKDDDEVFYYIDNLIANEFCNMDSTGGAIYCAFYFEDEEITLLDDIKYQEFSAEDYFFDNERKNSEVAICYDPHKVYALVIVNESKLTMQDIEILETDKGNIRFNKDKPNVEFKDNQFVIVDDEKTLTKKESLSKPIWADIGKDIWDKHIKICYDKHIMPLPKEWLSMNEDTKTAVIETIYDYTLSQINETPRPTSIRPIKPQSLALMQSIDEYFGVSKPHLVKELFPFSIPKPTATVVDIQPIQIEAQ